ncbi:MAG TPA: hypothetical protein VGT41_01880 [Candidatus Babeliales bacterium]|nr:hypothetical protein [Candidatus Babeliales bacterium]
MLVKSSESKNSAAPLLTFSGNIFIFHAFDIGEEINLELVKSRSTILQRPYIPPKYFKNYHIPLSVELPHPHATSNCVNAKIHNFGALSLTYQIPFDDTLEDIRANLQEIGYKYQEQSVIDAHTLFKKIKPSIIKPHFFYTKSSYFVIQLDPQIGLDGNTLKEKYGSIIASSLRFETSSLSEYQKNQILEASLGYFKGDLTVIDTESALVYDREYEELLDFFEFGNIQQLELRYFDRLLDQQLNLIYEEKTGKVPLKSYLPFLGTLSTSPIDELGKLKADISVITERLSSSIKIVGDPYFSELYATLENQLDIENLKATIEKKLAIVHDIRSVWQHKVDAIREDLLTVLIIILILIELLVAVTHK